MKQIAVIFLLLAFTVQVFNRAVLVFDYYTNTASFAKQCENKNMPLMHCNGKCQLMKKLKAEEQKEQRNTERKAENRNEVVSSTSYFHVPINSALEDRAPQYAVLQNLFAQSPITAIFHPPGLA